MNKIQAQIEIDNFVLESKIEEAFYIFSQHVHLFSQDYLNDFFSKCVYADFNEGAIFSFKHGARLNDSEILDCIFKSIQSSNLELIDYLISSSEVDLFAFQKFNETDISHVNYFLSVSAAYGTPEIVDYFLSKGANIHYCDNQPFCFACSHHNLDTIKYIYNNYPIDINLYNSFANIYPLNWAISTSSFREKETVCFLLDNGAQIDDDALDIIVKSMDKDLLMICANKFTVEQAQSLPTLMLKYMNKDAYYKFSEEFVSIVEKIVSKCILENALPQDNTNINLKKKKI